MFGFGDTRARAGVGAGGDARYTRNRKEASRAEDWGGELTQAGVDLRSPREELCPSRTG